MPTRRATRDELIGKLARAWKRRHDQNPVPFVAGVVYGLNCALHPEQHIKNMEEDKSSAVRRKA